MPLASGTLLGPYEITAPLGAGGMGEVYKANDTRLGRTVAVKILKGQFTDRFTSEAKAISALNHPNICTLYDLGTMDSTSYLVMEYLEGKPLQGPLPWAEAKSFALQLLDALETAHRAGVIHRDVKPANILVTKTGIKLLDFGLAKSSPVSRSATSETQTAVGTIQGTPHYMAPEQAAGESVDARADIFAFGAVLYELLTGKRAFQGANIATVIGAVMKDDPLALSPLPSTVPPGVTKILRRCLAKDVERRYQSARDAALDMEEVAFPPATSHSRRNVIIGAGAAAFAAGIGLEHLRGSRTASAPSPQPSFHLRIEPPPGHRFAGAYTISPDGRTLLLRTNDEQGKDFRWLQSLGEDTPRPATPEYVPWHAAAWSPDSLQLAFCTDSGLQKLTLGTGAVEAISNEIRTASSIAWLDGDTLIAAADRRVFRVPASGGKPVELGISASQIRYLPGGKHFLYNEATHPGRAHYYAATSEGKSLGRVLTDIQTARFGGGFLFYSDTENRLHSRVYDAARVACVGDPVQIVNTPTVSWSVSYSRTVCYISGQSRSELRLLSSKGDEITKFGADGIGTGHPEFSANGKRILFQRGTGDIWIFDRERGSRTRLSFDGGGVPVWSHDESKVYFSSSSESSAGIYVLPLNGTAKPELVIQGRTHHLHASPDGAFLAATIPEGGGFQLVAVALTGERKFRPLSSKAFSFDHPQFSPDSKWLAYSSDETGRPEVYLMPFPNGGAKWPVSINGGGLCRWRSDGKQLFYFALDGAVNAVDVDLSGSQPKFNPPKQLFSLRSTTSGSARFAATPDGTEFLVQGPLRQSAAESIHIITNWQPHS